MPLIIKLLLYNQLNYPETVFVESYLWAKLALQLPNTVFHCDNLVKARLGFAVAVAMVIG